MSRAGNSICRIAGCDNIPQVEDSGMCEYHYDDWSISYIVSMEDYIEEKSNVE